MIDSDKLVYIQMPKTGCSHISLLLSQLLDGKQIGRYKHKPATPQLLNSQKYFVSSIRNPWDWYLSLWTYGVQGGGELVKILTQAGRHAVPETSQDALAWREVYASNNNVNLFRKWLQMVHNPLYSSNLGERYEESGLSNLCGFMTYRYLYLCCTHSEQLYDQHTITSYKDLVQFDQLNCYINSFIRQESLIDDLCTVVEVVRQLTPEEKKEVYETRRTNTSKRSLALADYYDPASIELVRQRDRLLVEKFNYHPPLPTTTTHSTQTQNGWFSLWLRKFLS